jgi:aryl-alcohol dehydrogenase-like predicted oxidoreductase
LFQELLWTLRKIADNRCTRSNGDVLPEVKADIANIAVRWVLDHPFVGAVLIGKSLHSLSSALYFAYDGISVGTRFGISSKEHLRSNGRVFAISLLDDEEKRLIQEVLDKSNSVRMVELIGGCGSEYRQS